MKNIFISLVIAGILCLSSAFAQDTGVIGVKLLKDMYSGKVFVLQTFQNSAAYEYGLKEGSEIISVNNKNVKKLNLGEVTDLIKGKEGTKVRLSVKYYREQRTIEIPRKKAKAQPKKDKYEKYWSEVVPDNIIVESLDQNILNNLNKKCFSEIIPSINYWIARKAEFKDSYDMCMLYPTTDKQQNCLAKLVKWASEKTARDIERELSYGKADQNVVKSSIYNYNKIQIRSDM